MKALIVFAVSLVVAVSSTAIALTTEQDITPDYVRSHPKQFTVNVAKDKNGLMAFTIVFKVPEPRYVVAHLTVRSGDRILASSDTPAFTKNSDNTFYFSVPPEYLPTSEFSLSASFFSSTSGDAFPLPGTAIHNFRLTDFVSPELFKSSIDK